MAARAVPVPLVATAKEVEATAAEKGAKATVVVEEATAAEKGMAVSVEEGMAAVAMAQQAD